MAREYYDYDRDRAEQARNREREAINYRPESVREYMDRIKREKDQERKRLGLTKVPSTSQQEPTPRQRNYQKEPSKLEELRSKEQEQALDGRAVEVCVWCGIMCMPSLLEEHENSHFESDEDEAGQA